jgi:hypothetical protein
MTTDLDTSASQLALRHILKWAALLVLPVLASIVAFLTLARDPAANRPKVVDPFPKTATGMSIRH